MRQINHVSELLVAAEEKSALPSGCYVRLAHELG